MKTAIQPTELAEATESFFDSFHPPEVREQLWEWLKLKMGSEHADAAQRRQWLFFYEELSNLLNVLAKREQVRLPQAGELQIILLPFFEKMYHFDNYIRPALFLNKGVECRGMSI